MGHAPIAAARRAAPAPRRSTFSPALGGVVRRGLALVLALAFALAGYHRGAPSEANGRRGPRP
eukprot:9062269-Pyramimonas_sp.AAC.1